MFYTKKSYLTIGTILIIIILIVVGIVFINTESENKNTSNNEFNSYHTGVTYNDSTNNNGNQSSGYWDRLDRKYGEITR